MVKAVVLGAAGKTHFLLLVASSKYIPGGIGQPLALLLKANPLVTEACNYVIMLSVHLFTAKP